MYYFQYRKIKIGNCKKLKNLRRMIFIHPELLSVEDIRLWRELNERWRKEWEEENERALRG